MSGYSEIGGLKYLHVGCYVLLFRSRRALSVDKPAMYKIPHLAKTMQFSLRIKTRYPEIRATVFVAYGTVVTFGTLVS